MDASAKMVCHVRLSIPLALWMCFIAADQFLLRLQAPVISEAISMAVSMIAYVLHQCADK